MNFRTEGGKFKYLSGGQKQRAAADESWRRAQGSRCGAGRQTTELRLPVRGQRGAGGREELEEVYVKDRDATSRC